MIATNHEGSLLLKLIAASLAMLVPFAVGCTSAAGESAAADTSEEASALGASNFCPDNGTGLFVIDYGQTPSDWDRIIAKKPAFVVLGDSRGARDSSAPAYFHQRAPAIRVIAYVPMNYAHTTGDQWLSSCPKDYSLHHSCDNTPASYDCTQMSIGARIQNAMDSGYDGVFFDETPVDAGVLDYVHDCAAKVKGYGRDRLVIVNPGAVPPKEMFNADVDIVSVEHQDTTTSQIASYGLSPWRWLSVEDSVNDLSTAKSRFDNFRAAKGYWYDGTTQYFQVPPWFGDLADYITSHTSGSACSGGSSGTSKVSVRSFDLDGGGAELTGMWTVVTASSGAQYTGFTPYAQTLASGEYTVSVGDYGSRRFDHWENGATSRERSFSASSPVEMRAYYHTSP